MADLLEYIEKTLSGSKPIFGIIISAIGYVMFPDQAYFTAAMAVGIAMILDIATKYMALSHEANGYINAVRNRTIFSYTLWQKTKIKLTSYLIIGILAGLAYRVAPLQQAGVFLGTVVYSVIFLREAQSILENLDDAGADVGWLIRWTKKKQNKILENDDLEDTLERKVDDYEQRI